jgi:hypothetical protein
MYQACPKQYELKYLNTFEYKEKNSLFLLQGIIVHDTLRWLYQNISFFIPPNKEAFLMYFQTKREELLPQHNFLDLGDQTVVEAYQTTKHQLISYYDQQQPFTSETIIGLEQKLFAKLGEQYSFSVTIDRITKQDDTFIIYDYKTNKTLTPEIQSSHREQMYLYARALQQNYGKYFSRMEIHLEYIALQTSEIRTVDPSEIEEVLQKYLQICKEIESKKEQYSINPDGTLFPPQKAEHCRWCAFMSICPAFSAIANEAFSVNALNTESISHLIQEYLQDTQTIKALEQEKADLKIQLEAFFEQSDYQRIFSQNYQITFTKRDNRTIKDSEQVEAILASKGLLESALSLDKTKLKKLLKS